MKKIISASTILMVIMFCVSCKSGPKKPMKPEEILENASNATGINKGTKTYEVDLPKGWTVLDTIIKGIKFRFLFPEPDVIGNKNANMNIVNEAMQHLSLDEYMKKTEESMESGMDGFTKIDKGDIEAGALKGKWLHYSIPQNGKMMESIAYIFPSDDGIAYIITAATLQTKMPQFRPVFDGIAKSFRFTN